MFGRRTGALIGAVSVGVVLAASVGPAAAAGGIERIRVERGIRVSPDLVATQQVLVSVEATTDPNPPAQVIVSGDGARWRRITLPNAPARIHPGTLARHGGVLTFTARGPIPGRDLPDAPGQTPVPGPLYVWTSHDGLHWSGGQIMAVSTQANAPYVNATGRTLLTVAKGVDGRFAIFTGRGSGRWVKGSVEGVAIPDPDPTPVLYLVRRERHALVARLSSVGEDEPQIRSVDGGRTWRAEPCSPRRLCIVHGWKRTSGLVITPTQSSTDGGRHWSRISIDARIRKTHPYSPTFEAVTRVRDGWLAVLSAARKRNGTPDTFLLRSGNGRTWTRAIRPPSCHDRQGANSFFSVPARLDDHLYVPYECFTQDPTPSDERMYESDASGTRWTRVDEFPEHLEPNGPMVPFRGRLLVPVVRGTHLDRVTQLVVIS